MTLEHRPSTTATAKTPVCAHAKTPGLDADFCPVCRIYYPTGMILHSQAKTRRKAAKTSQVPTLVLEV